MNTLIEFKKQRELGEILTDTFAFIRLQFKPFMSTFFKIVGPYLVVTLISSSLYLYFIGDYLNLISQIDQSVEQIFIFLLVIFIYVCSLITVYTMSQSMVLHYIKSYTENDGIIVYEEIKRNVYDSFWRFIGLGFLVGISIIIGAMCCYLPGIYLMVPLSLSFGIMVFKEKAISDSYQYSFKLIKDEWWITFATILVMGIIVGIAGLAFSIPTIIYQQIDMGIFSGEVDPANMMDSFIDPVHILLNIVGTTAQLLLNVLSIVAGAFIYFNLNEKKNFTGTFERIQNLGENPEN
ncbi:MAG: hypothetical protein KAJ23_17940 [Maribacter sp.]|nr:hypothetical protein [Maribacter sp.]